MPGEADTLSVLDSYRLHLIVAGLSENTITLYAGNAERLLRHAAVPARDLIRQHAVAFLAAELARGQSRTSVNLYGRSIRPFLRWLHEEGITVEDASQGLRIARPDPRLVTPLTDVQVRALLMAATTPRDAALMRFLLDSGARVGECASLVVESLDLRGGTAMVTGKTGQRLVAYGPRSALVLSRWLRTAGIVEGDVWIGKKGPMGVSGIQQVVKRISRRAIGEVIGPHRLRHTWADRMMRSGLPDRFVMTLGGWKDPSMLRRYAAASDLDRARASFKSWMP